METTKFSLYNREISENYRNEKFYLMLSNFTGAMAYWLASNQHRAKTVFKISQHRTKF